MSKKVTECRLCRSTGLLDVLDLGDQELTGVFPASASETLRSGQLLLVWCRDCSLVQLGTSFPLNEMYGDNYGYRSGLNASMEQHLGRKARFLEVSAGLRPGDTVLDIGSNDGTLLRQYATSGIQKVGIDPTAAKFRQYYEDDVEVVPDFFTADSFARVAEGPAKLITSISMFYDLDNPVGFAKDVAASLAPEGLWHLEQSYMPSMLRTTSYDTICHEHLDYYSLETLSTIMGRAGLRVVDVRFNKVNGGSFAVTVMHEAAASAAGESVLLTWFMEQEKRMGLTTPAPFRDFEAKVFQHRNNLVDLVRRLRSNGATIMGLGASTKGNVLLQFCGFTPDDITAIAEVNEDKFGKVTPGTGIPIISETEARAANPDYFFVLPWHFREGIVVRERAFLENGGRLIFPLPEIEIIGD